jgi:hypothetical protein
MVWVRLKCGMHVGSVQIPRPSRWQGMKNRIKKTFKRVLQF